MIKITESARDEIKRIPSDRFLKITIDKTGCCSYSFEVYEDFKRKDDVIIETEDGTKIIATQRALDFLQTGGTIDYGRKGLRKGYWFKPL